MYCYRGHVCVLGHTGGGGGGPKDTTDRVNSAHTPIRPRAKMLYLGALGLPPSRISHSVGSRVGCIQRKGHFFLNT